MVLDDSPLNMLYFSDTINSPIFDQTDKKVGKVLDVAIENVPGQKYPSIVGLSMMAKEKKSKNYFIKNKDIESFTKKSVIIKKNLDDVLFDFPKSDDIIFLKNSVLDRQIVDLSGIRMVRVNDLQLGYIKNILSLVAIEIGKSALIRRLGLPGWIGKKELVDWEGVRLLGDKLQLSTSAKDLNKLHPADVANLIEKMNLNQGSLLLETMDEQVAARVLEEIEPEIQKILIEKLGPERGSRVMQKMSVDELVDLIQLLPDRKSKEFMAVLPADTKKANVKKILEYNEDEAGGLMTTEYITSYPDNTIGQVVETVRRISHMHNSIYFIYVINREDKFLGIVSIRSLLVADNNKLISDIMKNGKKIATVKVEDELLDVATLMTKYNLSSVAVLNDKEQLLGVVTVDDIMRHFVPHA